MKDKLQNDLEHLHQKELGQKKPPFNFFISIIAFLWSFLQIWVASPIQYDVASYFNASWMILNDAQMRSIHLGFGMFLVFFLFPIHRYKTFLIRFLSNSQNLLFSALGSFSALYLIIFYGDIVERMGMPSGADVVFSLLGIALLLEAARRTVGIAMAITAGLFLIYSHFGQYMPEIISHSGYSLSAIASHMWLTSEGVFGTPLGVSVDFIFLYVLFGNLLEKTGAGKFFVQLAFALLGRFKAGPAKAAVVASGLMGMISGSSIANTITVGSITIPLMKKTGLSAEKAASIEVSAGVNGQVTPPIMGAAAFLMAEYLSIPYYEVVKMAFLPSLLTYISLLYIVHIEGCKINMKVLSGKTSWGINSILKLLLSILSSFSAFCIIYYLSEGFGDFVGLKRIFSTGYIYFVIGFLCIVYVFLLKISSKANLVNEDENMLQARDVLMSGLHHFIPLFILIWALIVEKLSPALAAFWSVLFLFFELFTSKAIQSFFKGEFHFSKFKDGLKDVLDAMISGSKSMIIVSIATATAGIIVGSISLTGVGLKITAILDYLVNSNILITLILTALICIILGMGMPTTACYIIVSTLMIPALSYFMDKHELNVPRSALHLFVFYLGLMADVTPPVGLASYAAAAIAHANALKTSVVAFSYNIKTMILPFFFIFNPAILLYGVNGPGEIFLVVITSIVGIMAITASTQQYFVIKNRIYETFILFFIGISFLAPKVVIDAAFPKFSNVSINSEVLNSVNQSNGLRVLFEWEDFWGDVQTKSVSFENLSHKSILNQLGDLGINVYAGDGMLYVSKLTSDIVNRLDPKNTYKIVDLWFVNEQPNKKIVYIFSFLLFCSVYFLQNRRNKKIVNA